MFPLFEVICIKNGEIMNPKWHQKRFCDSIKQHYGISCSGDNLLLNVVIPESYKNGLCKLRIAYNNKQKEVLFSKYQIRDIESLKIVEDPDINYTLKYTNRKSIDQLYSKKGHCDDILIIKNGKVTDSSYTNIVFYDGDIWVTPKTCLLNGTMRQRLLAEGVVVEREIPKEAIHSFKSFKLINAMRDFNEIKETSIANIKF